MTPPSKFLFFPTQSTGTTTWRDEADHSFEATVTTSWSTSSLAPGMIGYDNGVGYNYTITTDGDLEPSNATCSYGNIAVGGDLVWWVTAWFGAYTTIGIDFRNHPDSTQSSTGSEETAMSDVLTANSDYEGPDSFTVLVTDDGLPALTGTADIDITVVPPSGCGCQSSGGASGGLWLFLLVVGLLRRRSRRPLSRGL